jgi:hypothetical protein
MKEINKLILKGSYSGINKFKKLIHYDIIKSIILNNECKKNEVNIHLKNNKLYVYHSFSSINKNNYSGRWYNVDLLQNGKFSINHKNKIFTYIIPSWKEEKGNKLKTINNVKIHIYFNNQGWTKINNFIKYHNL